MNSSIERKILFPFLAIVLIPGVIIGLTSIWSSYQSDKQQKMIQIEKELRELNEYVQYLDEQINSGKLLESEAKKLAKELIDRHSNVYLRNENGTLLYKNKVIDDQTKKWAGIEKTKKWDEQFGNEKWVFVERLEAFNWILYIPVEFSIFSESLINIQKYTLLIVIISTVIAMELTIILSHHLSKPIVHLVKYCESIRQGRIWRENDDISMKRSDEIGVLSRELKEMVNTLQKRNQQLQKLQQINNTILNSTHVGMVLAPNASATWQLNEMAKRTFNHFYILKEKVYQFILKNQHHTERTEEIWEFKNGSERVYFAANLIPITKKGEILQYLISFEDITKRKNLENQLQQMERLASLGELASGLAHEIRNPLSGIKTTAELLMRRLKLGQDHRWLFENILKEIDRVQQIITHLLQLSRPIKTNPRKVNVEQVFKSTIALLEGLAEQQKVKIDYECENVELWIDLEHLRQILLNLLLNSIQAMPDGGKVAIKAFQQQHTAVIILQDSGVGIDQEIISKIFNPFFTTRNEGTGLGLSIVHQLVVLNNGNIHVESEVGIGSTFTLRFPMKRKGENDENINH